MNNQGQFQPHYNWNRYYDPAMGMYTQVDKITEISGGQYLDSISYNPEVYGTYRYAAQNPVGYVDYNGLQTTYWGDEAPDPDLYPAADDPSFGERGSELNKGLRGLALLTVGASVASCGTVVAGGSAYGAGYVFGNIWRYPNAGGIGWVITKNGKRVVSFDWHKITVGGKERYLLHVDIPARGVKHWPWGK